VFRGACFVVLVIIESLKNEPQRRQEREEQKKSQEYLGVLCVLVVKIPFLSVDSLL